MRRITVRKRGKYNYIAFKDSNPFEWATGYSINNAVSNLKDLYPCLKKEQYHTYIKILS